MNPARARKAQSRTLALKLQQQYRDLVEARGQDEIQNAAIKLGDTFNSNIEFIINVMRDYGGLDAKFEPMTTRAVAPSLIGFDKTRAND